MKGEKSVEPLTDSYRGQQRVVGFDSSHQVLKNSSMGVSRVRGSQVAEVTVGRTERGQMEIARWRGGRGECWQRNEG